jgi:hypothetical protein
MYHTTNFFNIYNILSQDDFITIELTVGYEKKVVGRYEFTRKKDIPYGQIASFEITEIRAFLTDDDDAGIILTMDCPWEKIERIKLHLKEYAMTSYIMD